MVNKKSEYRVQFCKYDADIGKKIWLDNRSLRACRKLTNQETHYWEFQICPEEYECTCTAEDTVSKTRQSLRDRHRQQEVATQVPDRPKPKPKVVKDEVDAATRPRGPSAPPRTHLKQKEKEVKEVEVAKDNKTNKGVQTKTKKSSDKTKVMTKPPPSPKRRRSQSQLPLRTSKKVFPAHAVDRWKLGVAQKATIKWVSEYQEQFSNNRDEFFSRSPAIRSRPTSAPPCTGLFY